MNPRTIQNDPSRSLLLALPTEIIAKILQELGRYAHWEVALTCRKLYQIAKEFVLFKTVRFQYLNCSFWEYLGGAEDAFVSDESEITRRLASDAKYIEEKAIGRCVRELVIRITWFKPVFYDKSLPYEESLTKSMLTMFSCMPNLESVEISGFNKSNLYRQMISSLATCCERLTSLELNWEWNYESEEDLDASPKIELLSVPARLKKFKVSLEVNTGTEIKEGKDFMGSPFEPIIASSLSTLKSLQLTIGNRAGVDWPKFFSLGNNLKELSYSYHPANLDGYMLGIGGICTAFPMLERLDLFCSGYMAEEEVESLVESLGSLIRCKSTSFFVRLPSDFGHLDSIANYDDYNYEDAIEDAYLPRKDLVVGLGSAMPSLERCDWMWTHDHMSSSLYMAVERKEELEILELKFKDFRCIAIPGTEAVTWKREFIVPVPRV